MSAASLQYYNSAGKAATSSSSSSEPAPVSGVAAESPRSSSASSASPTPARVEAPAPSCISSLPPLVAAPSASAAVPPAASAEGGAAANDGVASAAAVESSTGSSVGGSAVVVVKSAAPGGGAAPTPTRTPSLRSQSVVVSGSVVSGAISNDDLPPAPPGYRYLHVLVKESNVFSMDDNSFMSTDPTTCDPWGCLCTFRRSPTLLGHFFAVLLPTITPISLICYLLNLISKDTVITANKGTDEMLWFCAMFYVVGLILLVLFGVALLETTNDGTISGMVAQRSKMVSYLVIIVIVGIAIFTSCFVAQNALTVAFVFGMSDELVHLSVAASLSPLITCLILVVPVVVVKRQSEIGGIPDNQPMTVLPNREPLIALTFFRSMTRLWHQQLHFLFVLGGVTTGYTYVIRTLILDNERVGEGLNYKGDALWITQIVLVSISIASLLTFFVLTAIGETTPDKTKLTVTFKRSAMYFEFIALYYYIISILFASTVQSVFVADTFRSSLSN